MMKAPADPGCPFVQGPTMPSTLRESDLESDHVGYTYFGVDDLEEKEKATEQQAEVQEAEKEPQEG
jgi:hypothetical protein